MEKYIIINTIIPYVAHELKAWLLHYSPVVLRGYLPVDYYQHHLLLAESIFLLTKQTVTSGDVTQSRKLLYYYCFLFKDLYGKYIMYGTHVLCIQ